MSAATPAQVAESERRAERRFLPDAELLTGFGSFAPLVVREVRGVKREFPTQGEASAYSRGVRDYENGRGCIEQELASYRRGWWDAANADESRQQQRDEERAERAAERWQE